MIKYIETLNELDSRSPEGRLAMMLLAHVTTTTHQAFSPDETVADITKRYKPMFTEEKMQVRNMSLGQAIDATKNGHKIAREGWNGKNMFVVYMPPLYLPPYNTADTARKVNDRTAKWIGEDKPLDCQPYLAMYNAQEQWIPGWVASQSDMLAEDWYIVE